MFSATLIHYDEEKGKEQKMKKEEKREKSKKWKEKEEKERKTTTVSFLFAYMYICTQNNVNPTKLRSWHTCRYRRNQVFTYFLQSFQFHLLLL